MNQTMPETARLAEVMEVVQRVQHDSREVTRVLLRLRTTPQKELLDRWRPVVQEATDKVIEASKVLEHAVDHLKDPTQNRPGWSRVSLRKDRWLHALLETASALTDLLTRLQAFEIEGRSVDQLNLIRLRAMSALPPEVRGELLDEVDRGRS